MLKQKTVIDTNVLSLGKAIRFKHLGVVREGIIVKSDALAIDVLSVGSHSATATITFSCEFIEKMVKNKEIELLYTKEQYDMEYVLNETFVGEISE